MIKLIYAINALNSPMSAFFSEEKAKIELKKRGDLFNDVKEPIESFILVLDNEDITNIIKENLELAKSIVSPKEEVQPNENN